MNAKLKELLLKLKLIDFLEEPNIRGETLRETIEEAEDSKREFWKKVSAPGYAGVIIPTNVRCFFCLQPLFFSAKDFCDRCYTAVQGKSLTRRMWRLRWQSFRSAIRNSPRRVKILIASLMPLIPILIALLGLWRS